MGRTLGVLLSGVLCQCIAAQTLAAGSGSEATAKAAGVPGSGVVEIVGPTVVGFFPAYTDELLAKDPGLASGLEHFQFAMHDTARCAEPEGVKVEVVVSDALRIRDGKHEDRLLLQELVPSNAGCYLVAPGRPPRIVRGEAGTSSLVQLCPAAASSYFKIASCCPVGFRCCSDGRVLDEATSCDG